MAEAMGGRALEGGIAVTVEQQVPPEEAPAPVFPEAPQSAPSTSAAEPEGMPPTAKSAEARPGRTRYRIILSVLFVLACLGIATSTVVVWVHQVALNTDRWVSIVGPLPENPDVRLAVSTRVADRVVTGLDIQGRLEGILPGPAAVIAAPIANQIEQGLQTRIEAAMATPQFQAAWIAANRLAHQQAVDILRGKSESIYVKDGYVVLDVWPLVGIALGQLQAMGIIPAGVQLPDLSQGLPPGAFDRLDALLGGRIPDDIGTVPLVPADKLERAQQLVSAFDWITVLLVLLTIVLIVVTIWYSARRLRTAALLALGGAIALVLARFAIGTLQDAVLTSVTDPSTETTLRGVVELAFSNLYAWSRVVIVVGVLVAIVAYFAGRPAWAVALSGRAVETGGRAAAGVGSAAAGARTGAPTRETAAAWARANRRTLNVVGIGAIAFVLLWLAAGFWIATLGVALVAVLEFALGLLGGDGGSTGASAGTDGEAVSAEPGPPPAPVG